MTCRHIRNIKRLVQDQKLNERKICMQHFWVLKYRNGWRLFSSFKANEMKERDLVYFFPL